MTFPTNSLDAARNISQDAVRAGLEELARYLHAAPSGSAVLTPPEATLAHPSTPDDPARLGLDELDRTMEAARRDLHGVA